MSVRNHIVSYLSRSAALGIGSCEWRTGILNLYPGCLTSTGIGPHHRALKHAVTKKTCYFCNRPLSYKHR